MAGRNVILSDKEFSNLIREMQYKYFKKTGRRMTQKEATKRIRNFLFKKGVDVNEII